MRSFLQSIGCEMFFFVEKKVIIYDDANSWHYIQMAGIAVAETAKGTRPGFSTGMPPEEGMQLFEYLIEHAIKQNEVSIARGCFGAYMQVNVL